MPSLKWLAQEGRPRVFPVFKKVTSIGRALANDVAIDSKDLSDHHAQLLFDGKDFAINETAETGELTINGKKKRRSKIFHGDRLKVGSVELVFSIMDEPVVDGGKDDDKVPGGAGDELAGMHRLVEFSEQLNRLASVEVQLQALVDAIIDVTNADKGFVILVRGGASQITVARNLSKENLPEDVTQLSDSILQKVIETRKPVIVSDAVNDTVFRGSASIMNLRLSSVMCAPLVAEGELLGLIYVGNDTIRNLFDESQLALFSVFATQGALLLQNALLRDALKSDRDNLAGQLTTKLFGDIIGSCPSLVEVFTMVDKVAGADVSVLITGETGTGKELIAREIHRRSRRGSKPFIVVNCGAIPENLMESELFGHVKGSFTGAIATRDGHFQAANGGTLFLDEIGEMPIALQVKLLRAIQERVVTKIGSTKPENVDIRILAATNRSLEAEIPKGTFREDLYYRLNVVNIHLPPLRDRGDDVIILAKYLLKKHEEEFKSNVKGFTPAAVTAMKKFSWPGNIRQLENRIKKALVMCDKSLIGPEDLELTLEEPTQALSLAQAKEEFQRTYILDVLNRNNGNRTKTARDLDVDPRTIFRYLEREGGDPTPDES